MKKFFFYFLFPTLLLGGVIYILIGHIKRNPDVIIKEDSEYLWVKTYSLYNKDSCIYKYHQPIIYEGEVINRRIYFAGVHGKGGHWVHSTDIRYNGNKEYTEMSWSYYDTHKEGDKVKIKVSFYPYYEIEVLN